MKAKELYNHFQGYLGDLKAKPWKTFKKYGTGGRLVKDTRDPDFFAETITNKHAAMVQIDDEVYIIALTDEQISEVKGRK